MDLTRVDVTLAAAVASASLLTVWLRAPVLSDAGEAPPEHPTSGLAAWVLILLACAALAWRRRAPGAVLLACVLVTEVTYARQYLTLVLPFAVLVAGYTVAQRWRRWPSLVALATTLVVVTSGALVVGGTSLDDEALTTILAIVTAWALGLGDRLRQAKSALLADRARILEDYARHLADEQQALAQLAVERERATIARELHDIVANNVGVMVAWAAASSRRAPSADRDTWYAIEKLGRETLCDVRRLVGVLHVTSGHTGPSDSPRLDRLPVLVDHVAAAGIRVTLEVIGTARELPAAVELNAYRIVQESLTNAMKHAAGARVEILVEYGDHLLHLRVRDHGGLGSAPDRLGSGLVGMRQRVTVLGGSLAAGPVAGDEGFVVDAEIPLRSAA